MARLFSPAFNQQFFDENGKPLAAGKLYTYVAGSSTPVMTYKSITGSELNTNPIILDAAGYADFVLELGASYKFVLKDKNDVFKKQWDNVTAADISSVIEGLVTDIEGKANKANPSTNGNLAALDAFGNVKDSNHKASDFALQEDFEQLSDVVDDKADKDNVVTDVTWDSETRKIKKTINGVDYDIVQVQQSISQSDPRPINSQAVKNEKYLSVKEQSWTYFERAQARQNINAIKGGSYSSKGSVLEGIITEISWSGFIGNILSVSSGGSSESGHIPPVANVSDRGKVVFVKQFDGDWNELVYRFILENCDTNAKVIAAVQNGQIPYHTGSAGKYLPYIIADNGDMYLYNVFGVLDNNPMTGDALGISLRKRVYNGNVIDECNWGKPYGLNYIEVAECKCNNNYHLGLGNETIMAWRRIPMDRDMVITAFSLIGKTASVKKAMMVGIFEVEGASVTNVSESSTWTEDSGYYYNDMENAVRLQDIITSGSGAHPFVTFSLSEPLTLHAGKNYLFPCRFNDDNTYNDPWVYTYKRAVPAMPWEELVRNNTENGNPVMSTAMPCCKPSALYIRLANGTEMWI